MIPKRTTDEIATRKRGQAPFLALALAPMLAFLLFVSDATTTSAQIYPVRTDRAVAELEGPVKSVRETGLSWNDPLERWNGLTSKTLSFYSRSGELIARRSWLKNRSNTSEIYIYDSTLGRAIPVPEQTALAGKPGDGELVSEILFQHDEEGRRTIRIDRDYRSKTTDVTLHVYDDRGRLHRTVRADSTTGYIDRIEEFVYRLDTADGRLPGGSIIRHYNPVEDPFRELSDTATVPNERVGRDYTFYLYSNPETPVIWLQRDYGRDTTLDRQTMVRYDSAGRKSAMTLQQFEDEMRTLYRAQVYNSFRDPISSSETYNEDRALERIFAWIYDKPDARSNWTTRRQYVVEDVDDPDSRRILLSRLDRQIEYYD